MATSVNSPRTTVVAVVGGLSALGGVVAGGVAALIAAMVLTPTEPVSAAQIALMAVEYGVVAGLAGSVLGVLVGFGALRRVPLGRLVLCTNAGLAAGLTAGWLGGPWAWHHMGFLGFVGFSAGALVARTVFSGSRASGSTSSLDSIPSSSALQSEAPAGIVMPRSPAELVDTPTGQSVDASSNTKRLP
ncbi:MAG: hypothetical protein ABI625_09715 [bacterium]